MKLVFPYIAQNVYCICEGMTKRTRIAGMSTSKKEANQICKSLKKKYPFRRYLVISYLRKKH